MQLVLSQDQTFLPGFIFLKNIKNIVLVIPFSEIFSSIIVFIYCLDLLNHFIEDNLDVLVNFISTVEKSPCLWRSKIGIIWSE